MKGKAIIIVSFFLGILIFALYGYFRATPSFENGEQETRPIIEILPESFDFGEVTYGQTLEHKFSLKNLGEVELKIKRIATSCACTKAWVEKEVVAPGESIDLIVKYETGAMSGPHALGDQERIIFVQTNDPINPQIEVMIYATVR